MSFEEPSSPAHKRMRLSSPSYDELIDDFDDEGLAEINRIELTLSQKQFVSQALEASKLCLEMSKRLKGDAIDETRAGSQGSLGKEKDNDKQAVEKAELHNEKSRVTVALTSTRCEPQANDRYISELSSSPQAAPPEPDYANWFNSDPNLPLTGFQRVSKSILLSEQENIAKHAVGFVSGAKVGTASGFANATGAPDAVLAPSKDALDRAAKRLKEWAEEDEVTADVPDAFQSPLAAKTKFVRPALASVSNASSFRPPSSPMQNSIIRPISTPNPERVRAFRSPFVGRPSPRMVYPKAGGGAYENGDVRVSAPSTPGPSKLERPLFSSGAGAFNTPLRPKGPSGLGSVKRLPRSAFSTPFKPGMGPGEPGRIALEKAQQAKKLEPKTRAQEHKKQKERKDEDVQKISLLRSGLRPQRYTVDELEGMGVNAIELSQITLQTAPFYVFYPDSDGQIASSSKSAFGSSEAHAHLQKSGRTHASRQWVDNQWSLVLWKLAGMACLDPKRETTPARRWCWRSALDQLERRYDKEIGRGARPALRLITTQDAPAASPMVLLVTQVIWAAPQRIAPDGRVLEEAEAEIEVSDGWYRLRANLDAPLARAVVSGLIKPGRKIAVAGAKLDNDRKDPSEILEAYESCSLLLGGNGTHLAPWYTKLGFQSKPFIATLGSLTPDGGPVPLMDLVIEKVYPVAYIEFKVGLDGKKLRHGPYSEEEEAVFDDKWQKLRDSEEAKVREELEARWGRWDGFADRLESCAAVVVPNGSAEEDSPPDHIDDLFDELDGLSPVEAVPYIRGLAPYECIHLARFLRRKSARDKELAVDEIEVEMKHRCPPRNVSNFRVVLVRDAQTSRKPANRVAQLTIWDVLQLCVSEGGKAGVVEAGQRFLMTNLNPTQHRAWMGNKKDDTVYLATRKNTKFQRLK